MTRAQRDARIIRARRHGWTYARIAEHYGVTRQRAWQIVNPRGRSFWCDAVHGSKMCLRQRGHRGGHKWGTRQIVAKAATA